MNALSAAMRALQIALGALALLIGALGGVVVVAVLVNLVELLCTAGLPALYTQVLSYYPLGDAVILVLGGDAAVRATDAGVLIGRLWVAGMARSYGCDDRYRSKPHVDQEPPTSGVGRGGPVP